MMGETVETKEIRVMHVEDHADFRDLMRYLLNSQSDMEVVAQAGSLHEARAQVASSDLDPAGPERAPGAGADEILDKLAPVEAVLDSVRKLGIRS